MQLTPGIYTNVTITGTGFGYLSGAGQLFQVMGKMVMQPGNGFDGNGSIITGSGSFALGRRATMAVTTAGGLSTSGATGDVQVTGTRTFSRDALYNYAGNTIAQITGLGLPDRVNTFAIYNQSPVTFTNSLAIRNVLAYYNGTVPVRPAGITLTLLPDNGSRVSVSWFSARRRRQPRWPPRPPPTSRCILTQRTPASRWPYRAWPAPARCRPSCSTRWAR